MQAQGLGRPAWYNATVDGRLLAQGGKWLIPLDLQQWPKALPNRGTLGLDVLQLPQNKAPWMKNDEIHICSNKDSEVLALQPSQAEIGDDSAYLGMEGLHSQAKVATTRTAVNDVDVAAVNSSASVALQPALA